MNTANNRPVLVFQMVRNNETRASERVVVHAQGWLHQFSLDVEEGDTGFASYAIAIVELPDGTIVMPRADRIQFLDIPA
jgi:hypothetical protein